MRVIVSALAICAASFLAGVVGDLSTASALQEAPAHARIVQLPPATLPPLDLHNAVRARPLPLRPISHAMTPVAIPHPAALVLESPAPIETESAFESLAGGPEEAAAAASSALKGRHLFAKTSDDKAGKA
jgi:hypothetical protein